jgi:hypothetical protein
MPASLYKDSIITAFHSSRMIKFIRWLTGEMQGDLGTRGPGWNGATAGNTVKVVEAWDAAYGLRSVSSDGTIGGLNGGSTWLTDGSNIQNGWIVIEFDGTGVNGNTGWQWFLQFNGGTLGDMDETNVVIPAKDWVTNDGVASSALATQAAIAAETASGLCTQPSEVSGFVSSLNSIWYGWADNGMAIIISDDTAAVGDFWWHYAGEVDNPPTGDTRPFVASNGSGGSMQFAVVGNGSNNAWSRISPVDGTTLLIESRPISFCQTAGTTPWDVSFPSYADFGGYPRSPVGVGFFTGGHQHIAGTLRYVNVTHENTGARWTSDGLTRIGWSVQDGGGAPLGAVSLDWDGTTPHP